MKLIRTVLVAVGVAAVMLTLIPAAVAGPIIQRAAHSLVTDPVYVDPNAVPSISPNDAATLRDKINSGKHPMFIAVLPKDVAAEVNHDALRALTELHDGVGLTGVYAFWAGGAFRAKATDSAGLPNAEELATSAYQKYHDDGPYQVLQHYVDSIEKLPTAAEAAAAERAARTAEANKKDGFPWWIVILLGFLAGAAGLAFWWWHESKNTTFRVRQRKLRAEIDAFQESVNMVEGATVAASYISEAQDAARNAKTMGDLDTAADLLQHAQEELAERQTAERRYRSAPRPRVRRRRTEQRTTPTPESMPKVANRARRDEEIDRPTQARYPGTGYGYYGPGLGWGYYGWDGNFVTGVLIGEALADRDTVVVERPAPEPERQYPDSLPDERTSVGGGGSFDEHDSDRGRDDDGFGSSIGTGLGLGDLGGGSIGGGGDWGGGGGGSDFGGGGGGGDTGGGGSF